MHGRYITWYPIGGEFSQQGEYEGSALTAQAIRVEGAYAFGRRHGEWREWNEGGSRRTLCNYLSGRKVGIERFYRRLFHAPMDEVHLELERDDNGRLLRAAEYHPNGEVRREGSYAPKSKGPRTPWMAEEEGVKHGVWRYYNPRGEQVAEGEWRDGLPWQGKCCVTEVIVNVGSAPPTSREYFRPPSTRGVVAGFTRFLSGGAEIRPVLAAQFINRWTQRMALLIVLPLFVFG